MKNKKDVIKKVVDYIEENLEEEINLDKIAKNAGYSKFYLNRVFTEQTGLTIHKYLKNRRLSAAAEKLVRTDKTITQIAFEAGYDSQQAFSFAFKQVYRYPPKGYRNMGIFAPGQDRISLRGCSAGYGLFTLKVKEMAA